MAYDLQAAKTKQRIKEEQMQVKVVERTQEIQVQQQEMLRRERELEATVRRPAEAEKYRLEKLAEANKNRVILEAEAESEAVSFKCSKVIIMRSYANINYSSFLFQRLKFVEKPSRSQFMLKQKPKLNKWQRKQKPTKNIVKLQ